MVLLLKALHSCCFSSVSQNSVLNGKTGERGQKGGSHWEWEKMSYIVFSNDTLHFNCTVHFANTNQLRISCAECQCSDLSVNLCNQNYISNCSSPIVFMA